MSFLQTQAVGLVGTLIGKLLQIKPTRQFESFSDFCSVRETHNASITPTVFPIEDGTQGTDHIVRNPKAITWDVIFSEKSNPQEIYQRLLDLMYSGVPFSASTGLKTYDNMVLTAVSASQDAKSSRILSCSLSMQEILITFAQTTDLAPRSQQAQPNVTGSTANTGTKQLEPSKVKTSALSSASKSSKNLLSYFL